MRTRCVLLRLSTERSWARERHYHSWRMLSSNQPGTWNNKNICLLYHSKISNRTRTAFPSSSHFVLVWSPASLELQNKPAMGIKKEIHWNGRSVSRQWTSDNTWSKCSPPLESTIVNATGSLSAVIYSKAKPETEHQHLLCHEGTTISLLATHLLLMSLTEVPCQSTCWAVSGYQQMAGLGGVI